MDIVCRLMCEEEFTKFLNGEVIKKENNGEGRYSKLVGNALSFTPLKFKEQISLGDISTILFNMSKFVTDYALKDAQKRKSPLYLMVATVNEDKIKFTKHMGGDYRTKYHDDSKELLADSYSIQTCKPWQLYEIEPEEIERIPKVEENFQRTLDGYTPLIGFPIRVSSYYEAMNDCLHKIYTDEQVREIYSRFIYVDQIADLKEAIDFSTDEENNTNLFFALREKLYGKKNSTHEITYSPSEIPKGFATKKEILEYANKTGNTSLVEMFEYMEDVFLDYGGNFGDVLYNFSGILDSDGKFVCTSIASLTDTHEWLEVDFSTGKITHEFKNGWMEIEEEIIQDDGYKVIEVDEATEHLELTSQLDFLDLRLKQGQHQPQTLESKKRDDMMRTYSAVDISEALKEISREGLTDRTQLDLIDFVETRDSSVETQKN